MNDKDCVEFLQLCLPKLGYRWQGFRKVRRQVCRQIQKRILELNLSGLEAYRNFLENNSKEWEILDSLCSVSISRFYRDRGVFDVIQFQVLPFIATAMRKNRETKVRCWSAGCCSGEEPYTINILWNLCLEPDLTKELHFQIVATERRTDLLKRAKWATYPESSLKDMPRELIAQAFVKSDQGYRLKDHFKSSIEFENQNIRDQFPPGKFNLILCRNLVFTYFQEDLQSCMLNKMCDILTPNGFLIIGAHEDLPKGEHVFVLFKNSKCIYQKI